MNTATLSEEEIQAARAAYKAQQARRAADEAASAARAANGEQFREALAGKANARTMGDRIKAAPRALRDWVLAVFRTMHLDKAAETIGEAARWAWNKVSGVFGLASDLGWHNIVGIAVTTPLRRQVVNFSRTAADIATAPVRWVWGAATWLLRKFEPTRKAVEYVERSVRGAALWIEGKVEEGLQWLERHDRHGAMSWLRWFFQANTVRFVIARLFPGIPGWVVFAASLLMPVYGAKHHPQEEAAIKRAKEKLADSTEDVKKSASEVKKAAKEAADAIPTREAVVDEFVETVSEAVHEATDPARDEDDENTPFTVGVAILADPDRAKKGQELTFEVRSFIDDQGQRYFQMGSIGWTHLDDLEKPIEFRGMVKGKDATVLLPPLDKVGDRVEMEVDIEGTVRTAQAATGGKPPKLPTGTPRAARPGRGGTGNGRRKAAAAPSVTAK